MRVNRQFNERLKGQVERSKGTGEWSAFALRDYGVTSWSGCCGELLVTGGG
jgi:hypothetical protein